MKGKQMYLMIVNGISVTIQTVINECSTWISKFDNIFFVTHNGRRFDFPVLFSACVSCGLYDTLISNVTGLVDSLPTFKTIKPIFMQARGPCTKHPF